MLIGPPNITKVSTFPVLWQALSLVAAWFRDVHFHSGFSINIWGAFCFPVQFFIFHLPVFSTFRDFKSKHQQNMEQSHFNKRKFKFFTCCSEHQFGEKASELSHDVKVAASVFCSGWFVASSKDNMDSTLADWLCNMFSRLWRNHFQFFC